MTMKNVNETALQRKESINGLKPVCPICVKSRQLSRNNASRDRYTHAQKQCEKGLLAITGKLTNRFYAQNCATVEK